MKILAIGVMMILTLWAKTDALKSSQDPLELNVYMRGHETVRFESKV